MIRWLAVGEICASECRPIPRSTCTAARCFNQAQPDRPVALKIGIHHGAAIAMTLNEELHYFGQTLNIAARVQAMADAQESGVTEETRDYPGTEALLAAYRTQATTADFRASGGRRR